MAVETQDKKRKGASDSVSSTKKRKSENSTSSSKAQPDATKPAKTPSARKRASDFFDAGEDDEEAVAPAVQEPKAKKTKVVDGITNKKQVAAKDVKAASKANSKSKPTVVAPPAKAPAEKLDDTDEDDVWADSEDEDVADQTAALLQGFGSSDSEDDDEAGAVVEVPTIPTDKALSKKLKTAAQDDEGPGVVYVGRVPHGFYEHQMKAYFSQFGDITRLRLSRNKKTGHSKHYAFIEFGSREVAKIVAATMNKYLLFGHILQVRLLTQEEVHPELFKGANKRFKPVPRNKIQGRQLRLPKERDVWEKRIEIENKRRRDKEEKLKLLGYDFKAPDLKSTKDIPFRKQAAEDFALAVKEASDDQVKALPAPEAKTTGNSKAKAKEGGKEVTTKSKKSKVKSKTI